MLDKILFILFALFIGLIFALAFTYKEIEIYYDTFMTVITMVSFLLSVWSFFKGKE
ncbi:MAG: hypothetical protein KBA66_01790 [Leptospiraceae bacterium]|nr:hypothetical protein [Leptospiraceae bacterium]